MGMTKCDPCSVKNAAPAGGDVRDERVNERDERARIWCSPREGCDSRAGTRGRQPSYPSQASIEREALIFTWRLSHQVLIH